MNEIKSYSEELCFEINMRVNEDLENFIIKSLHEGNYDVDFDINIKKIAEAINKQTPKKPKSYHTRIFGDDRVAYDCPNCKHCFTMMKPNCDDVPIRNQYCDICGQKLDWSEE